MSKQQIGEFLYAKRGHFYFQRRVPPDVRSFYRCSRVQLALGTRDPAVARRKAARLALDLEDQWARFREQSREDVLQRFLKGGKGKQPDPRPDEIKALYLDRRGQGKPKSFEQMVERAYRYLREICGHKALSQFERSDAVKFRDKLLARGMAPQSVKRNLSVISTGVKLMLTEHGLPYENVFAGLECGNTQPVKKRVPFTEAELRHLQREARELDDEPRWLLALISDTGLRLSEAAGLAVADVVLDAEIPHVKLQPHPWRPLKTASSARVVPLLGASLWAAERAIAASESRFLFPEICDGTTTKGNATSARLNKWIKPRVAGSGKVVHSFRHSMRDRLRAVECPPDIIDQLGGWAAAGVGQSYGSGYPLEVLAKWLGRTTLESNRSTT